MYESETCALRNAEKNLLERTEMRMLRCMMGIKRIEKIRNEEIRTRAGVPNISKKITEVRLRWLGCVEEGRGRCSNDSMEVSGPRNIGRPKLK